MNILHELALQFDASRQSEQETEVIVLATQPLLAPGWGAQVSHVISKTSREEIRAAKSLYWLYKASEQTIQALELVIRKEALWV